MVGRGALCAKRLYPTRSISMGLRHGEKISVCVGKKADVELERESHDPWQLKGFRERLRSEQVAETARILGQEVLGDGVGNFGVVCGHATACDDDDRFRRTAPKAKGQLHVMVQDRLRHGCMMQIESQILMVVDISAAYIIFRCSTGGRPCAASAER